MAEQPGVIDADAAKPVAEDEDLSATKVLLIRRLRTLRDERVAAEREATKLGSVLRAVALARHDRDAGTSKVLQFHRSHLEHAWADVEDLLMSTVQLAVRIGVRGCSDDPLAMRAQRAIDRSESVLATTIKAVTTRHETKASAKPAAAPRQRAGRRSRPAAQGG